MTVNLWKVENAQPGKNRMDNAHPSILKGFCSIKICFIFTKIKFYLHSSIYLNLKPSEYFQYVRLTYLNMLFDFLFPTFKSV